MYAKDLHYATVNNMPLYLRERICPTNESYFFLYNSAGPFLDILNKIKHILCGPYEYCYNS